MPVRRGKGLLRSPSADTIVRMPAKTERLSVRLAPEDAAMLQQLARATSLGASDVLRQLIRDAYSKQLAKLQTRSGFGFALGGLTAPAKAPGKRTAPAKEPPRKRTRGR